MLSRVKILLFLLLLTTGSLFLADYLVKYLDGDAKYIEKLRGNLLTLIDKDEDLLGVKAKILLDHLDNNRLDDFSRCIRKASSYDSCYSLKVDRDIDLISNDQIRERLLNTENRVSNIFAGEIDNLKVSSKDNISLYVRESNVTAQRELSFRGNFFNNRAIFFNSPYNNGERIRIAVLSDSFGAGAGLTNLDYTWARELEYQLNKIDDRFEVVVLAASGAGYYEYYNWVKNGYIDRLDADILIISFFENDFQYIDIGRSETNTKFANSLDPKISFYLSCFDSSDSGVSKLFNYSKELFPNLYRYFKFIRCTDNIEKFDVNNNFNFSEVVDSYKEINNILDIPIYFYDLNITSIGNYRSERVKNKLLKEGFTFLNDNRVVAKKVADDCGGYNILCDKYTATYYDNHFNNKLVELMVKDSINKSYDILDKVEISDNDKSNYDKINLVSDYLPRFISVDSNSSGGAEIGFINYNNFIDLIESNKKYSFANNFKAFLCAKFDRPYQIINFNRYLINNREVEINFEIVNDDLFIATIGVVDGNEKVGQFVKVASGSKFTFTGGEDSKGIVLLGPEKGCIFDNKDGIDIMELDLPFSEYLFNVRVL